MGRSISRPSWRGITPPKVPNYRPQCAQEEELERGTPEAAQEFEVRDLPPTINLNQGRRAGSHRGEGSDPYWTPCDYSTARGPNACGGD